MNLTNILMDTIRTTNTNSGNVVGIAVYYTTFAVLFIFISKMEMEESIWLQLSATSFLSLLMGLLLNNAELLGVEHLGVTFIIFIFSLVVGFIMKSKN